MSEIVSDSTPDPIRSSMTPRTWSRSTGTTVLPAESMRSTASRVSASEAGGSGLIMMIQPASGPGRLRAREVEDLAEAPRGDEADARALGLEHRVRRDGRAVDEVAQVAGRDAGLGADALDAGQHTVGRVAWRRRRLHAPLAGAVVVDEEQVGERPSHVHSQAVGHGCCGSPLRSVGRALSLVLRCAARAALRRRPPRAASPAPRRRCRSRPGRRPCPPRRSSAPPAARSRACRSASARPRARSRSRGPRPRS